MQRIKNKVKRTGKLAVQMHSCHITASVSFGTGNISLAFDSASSWILHTSYYLTIKNNNKIRHWPRSSKTGKQPTQRKVSRPSRPGTVPLWVFTDHKEHMDMLAIAGKDTSPHPHFRADLISIAFLSQSANTWVLNTYHGYISIHLILIRMPICLKSCLDTQFHVTELRVNTRKL